MKFFFITIFLISLHTVSMQGQEKSSIFAKENWYYTVEGNYLSYPQSKTEYSKIRVSTWGLKTSAGISLQKSLQVGLGMGAMVFRSFRVSSSDDGTAALFLPIYAELRGDFTQNKIRPYYALNLGMGIPLQHADRYAADSKAQAGLYFSPQLGMKLITKKVAWYILGSFQSQGVKYRSDFGDGVRDVIYTYKRYVLAFGIEF